MKDIAPISNAGALKADADYPAPDGPEIRVLPTIKGGVAPATAPSRHGKPPRQGVPPCRGDLVRPGGGRGRSLEARRPHGQTMEMWDGGTDHEPNYFPIENCGDLHGGEATSTKGKLPCKGDRQTLTYEHL
jgi:hypothetical protein